MREWIQLVENDLVHFPDYPPEVTTHVEQIIAMFEERGYTPSLGGKRIAMISPDKKTVIKIPLCDEGLADNNRESNHFRRQQKGKEWIKIAACRLFFVDREIGISLLMMRYVTPINPYDGNMPRWVDCVDCQQVGYDHKGDLVAYDL